MVIHRALREVDPSFQEELINYGASRGHMLNMAHFKDDSSPKGMFQKNKISFFAASFYFLSKIFSTLELRSLLWSLKKNVCPNP